MENEQMLQQTAIGFKDFLIFNRRHDADNLHDLTQLPSWVGVEPGEPGTLAINYINSAIEEHGIDAEGITCDDDGYLRSGNLLALKVWVETVLETADLLMLDMILWAAIPAWRRRDGQLAKD